MKDYKEQLITDNYYHVYGRANGNEQLFLSDENYRYFLSKFKQYIIPVCDTYSYCLMPNHYHFLLSVKEESIIEEQFHIKSNKDSAALQGFQTLEENSPDLSGFENLTGLEKEKVLSNFISKQFSNLLNSYTKAFNKQNNRMGSLFMRPFNRKKITSEEYLKQAVIYIHQNPVEAELCQTPEQWKYSSYNTIISQNPTKLERSTVLGWFNDIQNFIYCHQQTVAL